MGIGRVVVAQVGEVWGKCGRGAVSMRGVIGIGRGGAGARVARVGARAGGDSARGGGVGALVGALVGAEDADDGDGGRVRGAVGAGGAVPRGVLDEARGVLAKDEELVEAGGVLAQHARKQLRILLLPAFTHQVGPHKTA